MHPLAPRRQQVEAVFAELGRVWRICELSHKPFPTGRAAHGALDGLATSMAQHRIAAQDIEHIEVAAPPLILRLVGRPIKPGMDANYARLCLPYLAATHLVRGQVTLDDFTAEAMADPHRLALTARVTTVANDCTDPNALAPQTVRLTLAGGASVQIDLPAILGHPSRPLSAAAQRAKFNACCAHAGLTEQATDALHQACARLADLEDLARWISLMRGD